MEPHANSLEAAQLKKDRARVTEILGRFVAELFFDRLPPEAVEAAKRCMADTVGVALAARNEDVAKNVVKIFEGEAGPSLVWGTSIRTTARNAALANGAMAHAHDFDDGNWSMLGHPSSPVVPAVLALAEEVQASGREMITAYVAGIEVESKLGLAVTYDHNGLGWHTTCTLGTFGAAAAAASMLRLDARKAAHALGIAASLVCGIRQNFGSMTKPLHSGIAAQNGITAAKLAAAGVTASPTAIEGHEGFFDLFTGADVLQVDKAVENLGNPFEVRHNNPKMYPTCSLIHPGLDLVLDGLSEREIDVDDLKTLNCGLSYHALNIMRYTSPEDHLQARFSAPYCLASALTFGRVGIAQFAADVVHDKRVRSRMAQINAYVHPALSTQELLAPAYAAGEAFTEIEAIHHSGKVFKRRVSLARGNFRNPVSRERLKEKFVECAGVALTQEQAGTVWDYFMNMDVTNSAAPADLLWLA